MHRILVTGAAGYIGSHTCKALARAGHQPIGLDSLVRSSLRELPWGPLEIVDTAATGEVERVMRKHRPAAVVHFAAFAYVGESVREPSLYYRNNFSGSLSLLSAMRAAGIGNLVFSSSCSTYGVPRETPIREDHPQDPVNPYGAGKAMVERVLRDCDAALGLRSVSLRYFNAAGADPDGELGECHEPETHAIPLAIRTALGEEPVFEYFGTDYPTPDGTAIRDYVHVSDLALAHVRALDHLLGGGASLALNLGTGSGHSVKQVVRAVASVTGLDVPTRAAARREGDPPVLVADASRARQLLGWEPALSGLGDIVRTAFDWHRRWRSRHPAAPAGAR
jgi:UDP-arabinose 4-epimerase